MCHFRTKPKTTQKNKMKKIILTYLLFALCYDTIAQINNQSTQRLQKKFKTSCVSWSFHGFELNEDPEPAIDIIGGLGFDGIQMMICYASDLDTVWTEQKIKKVRERLKSNKLELTSICPFFPVVVGFGSNKNKEIEESLKNWERCCVIAQKLGTKRIELVGPFVTEFVDTTNSFFNNPYFAFKIANEKYQQGQKISLVSPKIIDYKAIENRVLNVLKQANIIAKRHGLLMILEPHFNSAVATTDGFANFWNKLKDPNIKLNTDAGWATMQCEYPPMNIYKMKSHLDIVQFRDVDNNTRNFVPMGQGVVNIKEIIIALRQVNFDGWLSFEEVFMPTVKDDAQRFLKLVNE
jgi:sugar phosphate isomerase/epimerase